MLAILGSSVPRAPCTLLSQVSYQRGNERERPTSEGLYRKNLGTGCTGLHYKVVDDRDDSVIGATARIAQFKVKQARLHISVR